MHSAHPRRGRAPVAVATGALALALCALGATPAHAAPAVTDVTLTASPTALDAGDTLDVAVELLGASDVFAYELQLSFDPAQLQYVDGSATGPTGGFDTVDTAAGSVTLLHTRLGSSPSLAGDLDAELQFLALDAGGSASVSLSSVTLVGTDAVSATEADVAESVVVITPAPAASPSPSPSTSAPAPSPSSSASASAAPAATGPGAGNLSNTGADATPMLIVAGSAIAAGLLALGATALRRRKAAQR